MLLYVFTVCIFFYLSYLTLCAVLVSLVSGCSERTIHSYWQQCALAQVLSQTRPALSCGRSSFITERWVRMLGHRLSVLCAHCATQSPLNVLLYNHINSWQFHSLERNSVIHPSCFFHFSWTIGCKAHSLERTDVGTCCCDGDTEMIDGCYLAVCDFTSWTVKTVVWSLFEAS